MTRTTKSHLRKFRDLCFNSCSKKTDCSAGHVGTLPAIRAKFELHKLCAHTVAKRGNVIEKLRNWMICNRFNLLIIRFDPEKLLTSIRKINFCRCSIYGALGAKGLSELCTIGILTEITSTS